MDTAATVLYEANTLYARANSTSSDSSSSGRPTSYKIVGLCLAIASGLFIGVSFVLKKIGLLRANEKYQEEAGEGYGYLRNVMWWTGMTLMIIGEVCNFVAYAFTDAILVTPLGALSVVITTILSAIFLKERLSFVGKIGCFNCIIGSVVIVLNAPEQSSVSNIQEMQKFVITPGFLTYAGVIILGSAFTAFWVAPRYAKKSMLVYISICSAVGGLSVVSTQGLGSAILAQIGGEKQYDHWFLYVLFVFVVCTLLTEIIYLNKALNIYNAALVTPTYYVLFTSATIVTSAILFQGFHGTALAITSVVMGFLQICSGVVLLQLSKSAKDVPDAAVFKGDLDQVREVAEQEQPETEPKADAIRGTAAIIRRISQSRMKMEADELKRLHNEKQQDQLEPLKENEIVEWDGLRRRKTVVGEGPGTPVRRKTLHPPLGMSKFPDLEDDEGDLESHRPHTASSGHSFLDNLRSRTTGGLLSARRSKGASDAPSPMNPVPLTEITSHQYGKSADSPGPVQHVYGLPPGLARPSQDSPYVPRSDTISSAGGEAPPRPPPHARRQFSFQNVFGRARNDSDLPPPSMRSGRSAIGSRQGSSHGVKDATEEERLGLVTGDSKHSRSNSNRSNSDHYAEDDEEEEDYGYVKAQEPISSPTTGSLHPTFHRPPPPPQSKSHSSQASQSGLQPLPMPTQRYESPERLLSSPELISNPTSSSGASPPIAAASRPQAATSRSTPSEEWQQIRIRNESHPDFSSQGRAQSHTRQQSSNNSNIIYHEDETEEERSARLYEEARRRWRHGARRGGSQGSGGSGRSAGSEPDVPPGGRAGAFI